MGGVGVLGDSTDSDCSGGGVLLSVLGDAFNRLIRRNFDRAGLSHRRTKGVSSNSVHRSAGLERKQVIFDVR